MPSTDCPRGRFTLPLQLTVSIFFVPLVIEKKIKKMRSSTPTRAMESNLSTYMSKQLDRIEKLIHKHKSLEHKTGS